MKYEIKNDAAGVEVVLFGDIESITARDLIQTLKQIGEKDLTLRINSYGGDFFSALAIYHALKTHKGTVTTIVDGIAASAATLIAVAGTVLMPRNSWWFVHGLTGSIDPENIDRIEQSLVNAYVEKTKLQEGRIRELLDAETWMDATQAVTLGFADKVTEPVALAARGDLSRFKNLPDNLKSMISPDPAAIRAEAKRSATVEIITTCVQAGAPELAAEFIKNQTSFDQVKTLLADPEKLRAAQAPWISDELKSIHALCLAAGVADLSERFINESRPAAWVKERLKDAGSIRAICRASGLPTWDARAGGYIRAGVSIVEARDNLFDVMLALQGPEIDNKLGPEGERREASSSGLTRERPRPLSVTEIYAARNRRPNTGADELGRKLAKVILDHGQFR